MKDTLCFRCGNACTNGCSWSSDLIPINGWEAEEDKKTFNVISCPEFVEENRMNRRPEDLDTQGVLRLMEAMAEQLRIDYMYGSGKTRAEIERFMRSEQGQAFLQLTDVDSVIHQMRRMIRAW